MLFRHVNRLHLNFFWQKQHLAAVTSSSSLFIELAETCHHRGRWRQVDILSPVRLVVLDIECSFMRYLSTNICLHMLVLSNSCGPQAWLCSLTNLINMETTKTCSPELQSFKTKPTNGWADDENKSMLFYGYLLLQYRRLNCQRSAIRLSIRTENTITVILTRIFIQTKTVLCWMRYYWYKTCITTNITTLQSLFVSHTITPVLAVMSIFIWHFCWRARDLKGAGLNFLL